MEIARTHKYFSKRKPRRCPFCGSDEVVPIVWGYPGPDLIPDLEAGKIVLGGCVVSDRDPSWFCNHCHTLIYPAAQATMFPDDVLIFVKEAAWTFAKTMPEWPHEYLVRFHVDEKLFVRLVEHVRAHGYEGHFYEKAITYYEEADWVYWTMGEPLEKTVIINRCRKKDTYEARLRRGALPERRGGVPEGRGARRERRGSLPEQRDGRSPVHSRD